MKRIISKIVSTSLCATLILGSALSAGAASNINASGGTGDSKVTITTASRPFKVTVPSVLPIWVDSDNNVTVATNAKIVNESAAPVEVTQVSVVGDNGWSLVPFNTDFTKVPVDTKKYGMMMQGADVYNGVDALLFDRMEGGAKLGVTYDGNVAIQSSDINKLDIGHVVFTVAWAQGERLGVNDITYNVENAAVQKHMATAAYNDNDHSYTYLDQADCVVANQKPAYGVLSVADGATSIVVTSEADGKTFTDTVSGSEYRVQNLISGITYNYQMKNSSGTVVKQGKIYPTGTVRMIAPNDSSTVSNIRDIGGVAANGGTLKYGKLYRGEALNGTNTITEDFSAYLADFLGITYEQDVRGNSNGDYPEIDYTAIKNASYKRTPLTVASADPYYSSGAVTQTATALKELVTHLADGDVAYLHCMGGQDRTGGTLLYLEGALGVSLSDIEHQQEISFWNNRNRTTEEWVNTNIASLYKNLRGNTFEEKCINFMLAHGISADQINRMRTNMIDGTPSVVTVNTPEEVFNLSSANLNSRLGGSDGQIRSASGCLVTNYIEIEPEAIYDISMDVSYTTNSQSGYYCLYDEDMKKIDVLGPTIYAWHWSNDGKSARWIFGDLAHDMAYNSRATSAKYIRFCLPYSNASTVSVKRVY